jgi:ABC-type taurine transport system substrate-binding protein
MRRAMFDWMLVTSKEINKPQDLLGKKVAVSGIRTTGHQLMTAWFKKFEINEKTSASS